MLQETEHFYGGLQKEVAKIVQCGEHSSLIIKEEATLRGLKFCDGTHEVTVRLKNPPSTVE